MWVRATCRGRFWPIRRGTSSACWVGAERGRGPWVGRLAGEADGGRGVIAGLVPGPASPSRITALKFPCPRDQAPWSFVLQNGQQPAPVTGSIAEDVPSSVELRWRPDDH